MNGVPLRRISQSYVIATSEKIQVALPAALDAKLNEKIFAGKEEEASLTPEFKQLQQEVDAVLLPKIKAVPQLKAYLETRFSLKRGQAPHEMKF